MSLRQPNIKHQAPELVLGKLPPAEEEAAAADVATLLPLLPPLRRPRTAAPSLLLPLPTLSLLAPSLAPPTRPTATSRPSASAMPVLAPSVLVPTSPSRLPAAVATSQLPSPARSCSRPTVALPPRPSAAVMNRWEEEPALLQKRTRNYSAKKSTKCLKLILGSSSKHERRSEQDGLRPPAATLSRPAVHRRYRYALELEATNIHSKPSPTPINRKINR